MAAASIKQLKEAKEKNWIKRELIEGWSELVGGWTAGDKTYNQLRRN